MSSSFPEKSATLQQARDLEAYKERVETVVADMVQAVSAVAEHRFDTYCTTVDPEDGALGTLGLGLNMMISDIAEALRQARDERAQLERTLACFPDPVFTVDSQLHITFMNEEACALASRTLSAARGVPCRDVFSSSLCGRACPLEQALADRTLVRNVESRLHRAAGRDVELLVSAAAIFDSEGHLVGGVEVLRDVTADRERERALAAAREALIQQLATPILSLWQGVLALPVIGSVDAERAALLRERLLQEIQAQQSEYVLIDITGVSAVDSNIAYHFLKVARAVQLLGCTCLLTGLSPSVAQTIAQLDVDLTGLLVLRSLGDGLRYCLQHKRKRT